MVSGLGLQVAPHLAVNRKELAMTTRHVRSALTASLLTLTAVALASATGLAQDAAIPEQGGMITMAGCFVQGTIKDHETLVLVRPIVGTVQSVADASCAMNVGDV